MIVFSYAVKALLLILIFATPVSTAESKEDFTCGIDGWRDKRIDANVFIDSYQGLESYIRTVAPEGAIQALYFSSSSALNDIPLPHDVDQFNKARLLFFERLSGHLNANDVGSFIEQKSCSKEFSYFLKSFETGLIVNRYGSSINQFLFDNKIDYQIDFDSNVDWFLYLSVTHPLVGKGTCDSFVKENASSVTKMMVCN